MSTTKQFFNVQGVSVSNSLQKNFETAIKNGYTHYTWYQNSDESWLFLSKKENDATEKAIELVIEEKKYSKETAEKYWTDVVIVMELQESLDNM